MVSYLIGLSTDARLVGMLAAEKAAEAGTGGVVGVSDTGRRIVARGPGPRTVDPDDGELDRGARRGLFEVID